VPRLKRVVKALNESSNSSTGYAAYVLDDPNLPPNIIADVLKKLNKNAEGTNVSAKYHKPLMANDTVRILVEALDSNIKQQIKNKTYKASHFATWSKEIYHVVKQSADGFVTVREKPGLKFLRGEVLKVVAKETAEADDDEDEAEAEDDIEAPIAKRVRAAPVQFTQKSRARVEGSLIAL
jgi:hypothetical protein